MRLTKKIVLTIAIMIITMLISTSTANATTVEITTETLNLRENASTDSDIVAQISQGETCNVISEEGDWYEVSYGDYTGYVSKEYVEVVGEESENNEENNTVETNETDDTNTEAGEDANNNTIDNEQTDSNSEESTTTDENSTTQTHQNITAETTSEVQVKITPLIQGSVIETLKSNTEVIVICQINGWAYIQTDTISGWVRENNLQINNATGNDQNDDNSDSSGDTDTNTTDDDNKNTTSDTNTADFEERTMYTVDYVNIRKEPSTSSDILMVVDQNTALKVVGESGDWYEVETSQGNAYVSKDVLSDTETEVTTRGNVDRTTNSKETQDKTNKVENEASSTSASNSTNSSAKSDKIVAYAKKFLGVPYVYGGASPSGFDCSGYTMYVFKNFGISMPHGATSQSKLGKAVSVNTSSKSSILNNLKVGDLVFFLDYETMNKIGHCGIYIGDGDFIHASSGSGYCVKINSLLPGEYYNLSLIHI